jgi:hypothetical protein
MQLLAEAARRGDSKEMIGIARKIAEAIKSIHKQAQEQVR